jgi:hypothetical protein
MLPVQILRLVFPFLSLLVCVATLTAQSDLDQGDSESAELKTAATLLRSIGLSGDRLTETLGQIAIIAEVAHREAPASFSNVLTWTRLYVQIQKANVVTLEQIQRLREHGVDLVPELQRVTKKSEMAFALWLQAGGVKAKDFDAALRIATTKGGRYAPEAQKPRYPDR